MDGRVALGVPAGGMAGARWGCLDRMVSAVPPAPDGMPTAPPSRRAGQHRERLPHRPGLGRRRAELVHRAARVPGAAPADGVGGGDAAHGRLPRRQQPGPLWEGGHGGRQHSTDLLGYNLHGYPQFWANANGK